MKNQNDAKTAVSPEVEEAEVTFYVKEFLECVDSSPIDLMRAVSNVRDLNVDISGVLRDLEEAVEGSLPGKPLPLKRIQRLLLDLHDLSDEKLGHVQQSLLHPLDRKRRLLDGISRIWDAQQGIEANAGNEKHSAPSKRVRRSVRVEAASSSGPSTSMAALLSAASLPGPSFDPRHDAKAGEAGGSGAGPSGTTSNTKPKRGGKVGRKANQKRHWGHSEKTTKRSRARHSSPAFTPDSPPSNAVDPDELTYCLCEQVSFGDMILCDNNMCPIEWFHFQCVSLVNKPKGKWYCPRCRGDKPTNMKPKSQLLKELEKYNQEKTEKAERGGK